MSSGDSTSVSSDSYELQGLDDRVRLLDLGVVKASCAIDDSGCRNPSLRISQQFRASAIRLDRVDISESPNSLLEAFSVAEELYEGNARHNDPGVFV